MINANNWQGNGGMRAADDPIVLNAYKEDLTGPRLQRLTAFLNSLDHGVAQQLLNQGFRRMEQGQNNYHYRDIPEHTLMRMPQTFNRGLNETSSPRTEEEERPSKFDDIE